MRTLLICAGVCLTTGTFVAAERLSSANEEAVTRLQESALRAALEENAQQANKKYSAAISALRDQKKIAELQVAELSVSLDDMTSARNNLARQVIVAQDAGMAVRENLVELEVNNAALIDELEAKEASLEATSVEIDKLTAQIDGLDRESASQPDQVVESAELIAEIAALNVTLTARDETIASLRGQLDAAETSPGDAAVSQADSADADLAQQLELANQAIEQLKEQVAASEANIAVLNETLRDREAAVTELEEELVAATEIAAASLEAESAEVDDNEVSARMVELAELVKSQAKTISHLRMGFEEEPASAMEMASACIERANKIFEISQIEFGTGTSAISPQSTTTLDHLRDLAIGCESDEMVIEIGGHTDSRGAETSNQRLSEARANSVREFLIGRGIPAETMIAVGFGESQPIASNATPVGRAQNRRITFTWQMREKTPDNIDG